jgi:hypothetical protein
MHGPLNVKIMAKLLQIFQVAFRNSAYSMWCTSDVHLPLILSDIHLWTDGVVEGFMNSVEVNSVYYRSQWPCGYGTGMNRSIVWIAKSNPAEDMDARLLCLLCFV